MKAEGPMSAPMIHSNGTGREALIYQQCDVANALRDVLKALAAAAPNERDYYPYREHPAQWREAVSAHTRRVAAVSALLEETQAAALAISRAR